MTQVCPVTERECERACERICRNYANGKVAPIRESDVHHPIMREYPFPLRPDCTVTLWLPKDLKRSEIVRLKAFMEALSLIEEVENGPAKLDSTV